MMKQINTVSQQREWYEAMIKTNLNLNIMEAPTYK